jgi:general secretion pathway protein I
MNSRPSGFTLLEVLVALAIFAIVGAALVKNSAQTVKQTAQLEERTIAMWLAENQLSEIRSAPRIDTNFPSPGTDRANATMAGHDWELVIDYEATENEDMRRVTVAVFHPDDQDNAVASLTGFVGRF